MALPKNKSLRKRPYNNEGRPTHNGATRIPQGHGGARPNKYNKGGKKDDKGGKNKNKGPGPNGMPKYYGALGPYKGVPTKKVNRLINGIIRGEIRDLRGENRDIRRAFNNGMRVVDRDYQRGKGDLDHVFGETADFLQKSNQSNQDMYAQQASQSAAANAALQSQLQGTYSGASDQVSAELERLGIQGAGPSVQMASDAAFSQAQAQQSGANASSSMDMAASNSNALGQLLQGMNQGQYQSSMGQNLNARNDSAAALQQDRIDNLNKVREAMRDVRGSRRDLFFQMLNQLQETGWGQFMDWKQFQMANKKHKKK